MAVLYKNNAASTLASGINTTATSIVLASGGGAKFPAVTGSDFFYLTILDGGGNFEIVKVTVRTVDTLTVVRAQEGTTALTFASGVICELRITGGLLDQFKSDTATSITSSNVTNALGFTPYNASNPSGYITGITSGNVTTALGFTPYNATNPNGYISGITSANVTTALGYTPYNSSNPSGYITGITSGMVTTALGFTPYNATNPSGYITSSALSSYLPLSGGTLSGLLTINGGSFDTTYTSSQIRFADGSLQAMKTVAGGVFEAFRAMNMSTTAGTTVRVLGASTSDPFNNGNGGKVFIDAVRTATNMDLVFSLNDASGAAPVERVRFLGSGDVAFPIGTSRFIGQTQGTAHLAGNVGSVGLGISDGGGRSGMFVYNTHNGTYSSQDVRIFTAEGGVSTATERVRIAPSGTLTVERAAYFKDIADIAGDFYTRGRIYSLNAASNGWNVVFERNAGNPYITNVTYAGNTILHAGNYNSYSPTLTGGGASGTWGISITGTARGVVTTDPGIGTGGLWVTSASGLNIARNGTAYIGLDAGNYNSYSPTLTGGNASGTWSISITGNAATATSASSAATAANVASGEISNLNTAWTAPGTSIGNGFRVYRYQAGATGQPESVDNANWLINIYSHPTGGTASYGHQLSGTDTENIWMRYVQNGSFGTWRVLIHSGNFTSYAATAGHNHTYDVNNAWLRDANDDANVKLYGNTRQMAFRTDGTTEFASGVGPYAFAWMYGGDAASNRRMLLTDAGRLWTNTHGWMDEAFAPLSHVHSYLPLSGGSLSGTLGSARNDNQRIIESYNTSAGSPTQFFIEHSLGSVNIGNARGNINISSGSLLHGGNQVLHAGNYSSYAIPISGGINMSGSFGLNDSKLYLRTNGDNNHYLWNAADDWEELVAYSGTGFRVAASTGPTLATFTTSGVYLNALRTNRAEGSDGVFAWRVGSGSGTTRHINLSDSDSDPSGASINSGITWGARTDNNPYYMIYCKSQYNNGYSNHTRLTLAWHTGIEIGAEPGYGGVRFFNNSPFTGSEIFSVGKGDSNVRVNNNLYVGGNLALHAGNYTSYAPSLTGSGASGTWGINITGNSATATTATSANKTNANSGYARVGYGMAPFYNWGGSNAGAGAPSDSTYTTGIDVGSHPSDQAYGFQIASNMWNVGLWTRTYNSGFSGWVRILDSSNYTSYAPSLTGSGASGTWGISITGTASGNIPRSGSWLGDLASYGYTREHGISMTGGSEFVVLSKSGQGYTLVDGSYFAYEGGGFYSSSNSAGNTLLGFYANGTGSLTFNTTAVQLSGNQILHAGNYTSYSPSLGGSGASGTWGISVTGSAGSVAWGNVSSRPSWMTSASLIASHSNANEWRNSGFYENDGGGSNWPGSTWYNSINVRHSNQGNYHGFQVAMSYYDNNFWFRSYQGAGTFQSWAVALSNQNYTSYAPSLTGSGASGTWGITITGNSGNTSSISNAVGGGYTWTGIQYFMSNRNTTSDSPPLQAFSSGGGGAIMSFHRGGHYAVNFGLDSDNVMRIGGWSAAANRWQLDMSGNGTYAGNVTAYSDERLKTNWQPMPDDYVARLAQVKVGIYDRIDEKEMSQVGVSAQSLQKLLPQAIMTAKDEMQTLSVSYGNAALASSVELAKEVVDLRTRVSQLEFIINQLIGD